MAFLLLSTGQVVQIAQTRAQAVTALNNAGASTADATVKGAPMTFVAGGSGGVIAVAENQVQMDFAMVGIIGG
jgi:pseudouridine-5'-phosphate glycosidase